MKTPSTQRQRIPLLGFTLIELLAAVTIILILAGLMLPHIVKFIRSGQNRVADTQARALVNAIKSYRTMYRVWPGQTNDVSDGIYTNHLTILSKLTNNPRNTLFIELKPEMLSADGRHFVDSWGRPFYVAMDENEDGNLSIQATTQVGVVRMDVRGETVGIISLGAKPEETNRWLYSWIQ